MTYGLPLFLLINFSTRFELLFTILFHNMFQQSLLYYGLLLHNIFNFFNLKNLFSPIWNMTFHKNISKFWYFQKPIFLDEKTIYLINLITNWISARSVPQILFLKDNYSFRFSNFLLIGLCNSSASSWFKIFSFLMPPRVAELSYVDKA